MLYQEAQLRFVKFLPDILTLQKDLVKKFQNISDLPFRTIADFLNSQQGAQSVLSEAQQLSKYTKCVYFESCVVVVRVEVYL